MLPFSTPDEATFVFWCHYKAQPNGEYCAVEFDFQHWDLDETDEIKTFKVVDPIEDDPGICPGMFDQEENNTQEKWFIRKVNRKTKMVHKYPVCQTKFVWTRWPACLHRMAPADGTASRGDTELAQTIAKNE